MEAIRGQQRQRTSMAVKSRLARSVDGTRARICKGSTQKYDAHHNHTRLAVLQEHGQLSVEQELLSEGAGCHAPYGPACWHTGRRWSRGCRCRRGPGGPAPLPSPKGCPQV
jgi:hypothetical protein